MRGLILAGILITVDLVAGAAHYSENNVSFDSMAAGPANSCKEPTIEYLNGTQPDEKDKDILESTKKGCEHYYGEGSCLVHLYKVAKRDWRATCTEGKQHDNTH